MLMWCINEEIGIKDFIRDVKWIGGRLEVS